MKTKFQLFALLIPGYFYFHLQNYLPRKPISQAHGI